MLTRRTQVSLGLVPGLALTIVAASYAGLGPVLAALQRISPGELGLLCAVQLVSVLLCGFAWWIFTDRAGLVACTAARFVRDGVSSVLAVVPGVGEVAGARALTLFGTRAGDAAGSSVVDLATEIGGQVLFTLAGVAALAVVLGRDELGNAVAVGAATIVPGAALLAACRSRRARDAVRAFATRLDRRFGFAEWGLGVEAARTIRALWRDKPRLAAGTLIHLAAWLVSAVQVWAGAAMLDAPMSPLASLALSATVHAVRGALFVVPWGAGVQEVGFVVAGAALGLDEASAVAMSLAFRVRDIVLALPALALWTVAEAVDLWRARPT